MIPNAPVQPLFRAATRPLAVALLVCALSACGDGDEAPANAADVTTDAGDTTSDAADTSTNDAQTDTPTQVFETPVVTQVIPASGPVEGRQRIGIIGENFAGTCHVSFGDVDADVVRIVNAGALDLSTPAATTAGVVDVTVRCNGGEDTLVGGYEYTLELAPEVDTMSPQIGATAGGELVTFSGNFFGTPERATVRIGDAFAQDVQVLDDNTITCLTPASEAGAVSVSIELDGTRIDLADTFLFVAPINVMELSPFAGDRAGGTAVTVTGEDLFPTAELAFTFGTHAADATLFTYNDIGDELIVIAPPSDTLGVVDVTIEGPLETLVLPGAFAYVDPITVEGLTPDAVPSAGVNRVAIMGADFADDAEPLAVLVGEAESFDVSRDSDTEITFLVPTLPVGTYTVTLIHGDQVVEVPETITVFDPITVDEAIPNVGATAGGTRVQLLGRGFFDGVVVTFNGALGTDVAVAADGLSLTVTTPPGDASTTPGDVEIDVRSPFSVGALRSGFTYADD